MIDLCKTMESEEFHFVYAAVKGPIEQFLIEKQIDARLMEKLSYHEVKALIQKVKPSIIHAHDYRASVLAAMAHGKIPLISHIHHIAPSMKRLSAQSLLYFLFFHQYTSVFVVSEAVVCHSRVMRRQREKVKIIHNPLDLSLIRQRSKAFIAPAYEVIFCGRLDTVKQQLMFIEIIAALLKRLPSLKAIMVGDGVLFSQCQAEIKRRGLSAHIHLQGRADNPYPYMAKSRVLVSTSQNEGFGLVMAEAMALGKPICSTTTGGSELFVKPGSTGFICASVEEFVTSIEKLLKDTAMYDKMSVNARAWIESFNDKEDVYELLRQGYRSYIE